MLIDGVFAAVPTPFYPDERVYFRKLEANMARYVRSRLAGMVLLGSTGEAPMLDDAESRDVLRIAAEAATPGKVLIAGVGRESVKATVELAEAAAGFHYHAILVRPPSYYAGQMSAPAVLHYFRCVADRSPLPVLLYNVPKCVPYQLPIELVAELAAHPNILGIKESSGSVERIRDLVAATSGGFQVLCGSGSMVFESLQAGAVGAILAFAAFAPQACLEIYLAWKGRDLKLAEDMQKRIAAANQRIVGVMGIGGVKYACDFNGFYGGCPRAPLLAPTAEEKVEIEKLLAEIRN
jgi:dihydrodipicolinate synthase/N-acetylneuraminate lyase